jgi:diacylglycerol kinase (ATP)
VLSVIPAGSGNDLARSLGIPRPLGDALRWALDRPGRATDAARAGERVWLNTAGVGFDAATARIAQRGPAWIKGSANYVRAVLLALATYRPVGLEVRVDGEVVASGPSMFTGLANGRYAGGGMLLAPNADPDDGELDVVGLNQISIPGFLMAFPKVYSGTHLQHPKVWTARGRKVTIAADRPVAAYADGEVLGMVRSLEAEVLPGALLVAR